MKNVEYTKGVDIVFVGAEILKKASFLHSENSKNLKKFDVIKEIPETLSQKIYFNIEVKFQKFALKTGISVNELDLLFWSMETGKVLK